MCLIFILLILLIWSQNKIITDTKNLHQNTLNDTTSVIRHENVPKIATLIEGYTRKHLDSKHNVLSTDVIHLIAQYCRYVICY